MWEAVETAPGVYNQTYLKQVDTLITKLGEAGIDTLVDAHQDVMSRVVCGEGMPAFYARDIIKQGTYCLGPWADIIAKPVMNLFGACESMDSYGYRKDADGFPLIEDCQKKSFFIYYTTPESWTIFRALWTNALGMQDKYIAYHGAVSDYLAKNAYVVGYDPTNEPLPSWTGLWNALQTMFPNGGYFDRYDLEPMYAKIFARVQKSNPGNILWFEPGQFPDEDGITTLVNFVFDLGFDVPPGGEVGSDKHVLNDHTYCCQLDAKICAAHGEPGAEHAQQCLDWHRKRVYQRDDDAKKLGIPLVVSEFGACLNSEDCFREISQVTQTCDDRLASWAYWEFKTFQDLTTSAGTGSEGFYDQDGTLQGKVKALLRTYVKSAQGLIQQMSFSVDTAEFNAVIKVDASIAAPTVIFTHQNDTSHKFITGKNVLNVWYPNGYDVTVTPATAGGV